MIVPVFKHERKHCVLVLLNKTNRSCHPGKGRLLLHRSRTIIYRSFCKGNPNMSPIEKQKYNTNMNKGTRSKKILKESYQKPGYCYVISWRSCRLR